MDEAKTAEGAAGRAGTPQPFQAPALDGLADAASQAVGVMLGEMVAWAAASAAA
jgi:hypothetical protein